MHDASLDAFFSQLSYSEAFTSAENAGKSIIPDYGDPLVSKPEDCSVEAWEHIEQQLRGYTINNISENEVDKGKMLTLVNDETKDVVIVYQGTCSSEGWEEDVLGLSEELTESQRIALQYANDMCDLYARDGYTVTATGHSKGGNQAALVAIGCDRIDHANAFDAPGFGEEFYRSGYGARAKLRAQNLTYYNYEGDYVSSLLKLVPGAAVVTVGDGSVCTFDAFYHDPKYLLRYANGDGSFETTENRPAYADEINKLCTYVMDVLDDRDADYLVQYLGPIVAAITEAVASDGANAMDLVWKIFSDPKGFAILISVLQDYDRLNELLDSILPALNLPEWAQWIIGEIVLAIQAGNLDGLIAALARLIPVVGPTLQLLLVGFSANVNMYATGVRRRIAVNISKHHASRSRGDVRDFTEERLEELRSLVTKFTVMRWFNPFEWELLEDVQLAFLRVSIGSSMNAILNSMNDLDEFTRSSYNDVERVFHAAWDSDTYYQGKMSSLADALERSSADILALTNS